MQASAAAFSGDAHLCKHSLFSPSLVCMNRLLQASCNRIRRGGAAGEKGVLSKELHPACAWCRSFVFNSSSKTSSIQVLYLFQLAFSQGRGDSSLLLWHGGSLHIFRSALGNWECGSIPLSFVRF